jgi:hypothetical protein
VARRKPSSRPSGQGVAVEEIEILRPERAKPSASEALKRMKAFAGQRKEQFVVRHGVRRPLAPDETWGHALLRVPPG